MLNLSENIKSIQESQQKVHDSLVIMKYLNERKQENLDRMNEIIQRMLELDEERKRLIGGAENDNL
ncbi:hypothetical protein [Domibacillus epiphyticus]|uniref:Uncharacterized protein n=1 Tax=Domibacillus epiphyticus TaxID=1714355 RepID=A0A1V2A7P9_9BACI|nr:hypothetical protein [Domibacillus epiphyticus]OMP66882.1 hypothetical protein BTO28_09725 [Domibacillus epiphyticus]